MEFILSTYVPPGLHVHKPLENVVSECEAIARAREVAINAKEGAIVALFTRQGAPLGGWKMLNDGKLASEPLELLPAVCGIGQDSYEHIKRQADKMRKDRGK